MSLPGASAGPIVSIMKNQTAKFIAAEQDGANEAVTAKLTEILSHGLVPGLGSPEPGKLCVEAAICLALGEPHSDRPSCVADADRVFATTINDARWPSDAARAEAMLPLALAQLGTAEESRTEWVTRVVALTIQRLLPRIIRRVVDRVPVYAIDLEIAAKRCEESGSEKSARFAAKVLRWAYDHSYALAYASSASVVEARTTAQAVYAPVSIADAVAEAAFVASGLWSEPAARLIATAYVEAAAAASAAAYADSGTRSYEAADTAAAASASAASSDILRLGVAIALQAYEEDK